MTDRQTNQALITTLTRISEGIGQTNKLLVRLVTSVDSLTAATKASYEEPMRLLADLDGRATPLENTLEVADDDDDDEISPEDAWRLG